MEAPKPKPQIQLYNSRYSKRVLLKTIFSDSDGGSAFIGQRVVIGGWVKSSKQTLLKKENVPPLLPPPVGGTAPQPPPPAQKDVTCVEMFQSKFPLFRSIMRVFGSNQPLREKVESIKEASTSVVYLQVSDGSCVDNLLVVVESPLATPSQIEATGTCILVEGVLQWPSSPGKFSVELKAEKIIHMGLVEQPNKYPLSKKRVPLDELRDFPHFRPRTTTVASVMRTRSALVHAMQTFFQTEGFIHVDIPILTTVDTGEGYSQMFRVRTVSNKAPPADDDDTHGGKISLESVMAAIKEKINTIEKLARTDSNKEALSAANEDLRKANELVSKLVNIQKREAEDFFSHQTFLIASGRLHLASYACSLGNVYSFGPRFRAIKYASAKHSAEIWMVELQMAFSQLEDAMKCADDILKFLCKWVLDHCGDDLDFVSKRIDQTIIDRLKSITGMSSEKITYTDAVNVLKEEKHKLVPKIEWGDPLTEEHESYLAEEIYEKPVIIYNYPTKLKPFYARINDDAKTVAAFDMVVPKIGTLIRGSQNEERISVLNRRMKEFDLVKEQYEWYLDLQKNGTVKQSGLSLGFDLMVLLATGLKDVNDVIPFPRSYGKPILN